MTDTLESLHHKIGGATELQSVVRTMKALAAASVVQYERAVVALADYNRAVELGLAVCFRQEPEPAVPPPRAGGQATAPTVTAVVFGSDQGLVGQFNEVVADFVVRTLQPLPGPKRVWAVGQRVRSYLDDAGLPQAGHFAVPFALDAVTPLVGQILTETETQHDDGGEATLYLFHNRPTAGPVYEPVVQRLLPLDATWRRGLASLPWPGANLPEVMGPRDDALRALVGGYLFVSLFRACAESLASENASRLAAMQRADKNIEELLEALGRSFHRVRQNSIDDELFDVIAGYESQAIGAAERKT